MAEPNLERLIIGRRRVFRRFLPPLWVGGVDARPGLGPNRGPKEKTSL